MTQKSLRLRLLLAAVVSIAIAIAIAGVGLVLLFERYVERRVERELSSHLLQLAAAIKVAPDGKIVLARELADPRFAQPLSGLYWQIDANGAPVARSRSLWDERLEVPTPPVNPEDVHRHVLIGPGDIELFSQERLIAIPINGKDQPLVLTAGLDEREIKETVSAFSRDLIFSLLLLGVVLVIGSWIQVNIGLNPLEGLRKRLEAVRSGSALRIEGDFPAEVQPLADEVNGLLGTQEKQIERARRRAGDLAHGFKTPITILGTIVRDLRRNGSQIPAQDIEDQVNALGMHVERELARARMATGRGKVTVAVEPALKRIIATMQRLPDREGLSWTYTCETKLRVAMDNIDLTELLGNLLDNARKWATTTIAISCRAHGNSVTLTIEDDGPGVPAEQLGKIAEPGRRLDESLQGAGLGLAIVADLAEVYGLRVNYGTSPMGGLKVSVTFADHRQIGPTSAPSL